jgi:hypothetical protein
MNDLIKGVLPMLSTALLGPFGGMAAGFIADKIGVPKDTVANITSILSGMPPEKLAELRSAEEEFKLKMAQMGYDSVQKLEELNVRALEAVNKTMQVEASAEHWPTYTWRPYIGFTLGTYINSMWILPMFGKTPVVLSPDLVLVIGAVLGVASFFRGKAQADPAIQTPQITSKG